MSFKKGIIFIISYVLLAQQVNAFDICPNSLRKLTRYKTVHQQGILATFGNFLKSAEFDKYFLELYSPERLGNIFHKINNDPDILNKLGDIHKDVDDLLIYLGKAERKKLIQNKHIYGYIPSQTIAEAVHRHIKLNLLQELKKSVYINLRSKNIEVEYDTFFELTRSKNLSEEDIMKMNWNTLNSKHFESLIRAKIGSIFLSKKYEKLISPHTKFEYIFFNYVKIHIFLTALLILGLLVNESIDSPTKIDVIKEINRILLKIQVPFGVKESEALQI